MPVLRYALVSALALFIARATFAPADDASVAALPQYTPREHVSGTIRLWGHGSPTHDFMGRLVTYWEQGFNRYQPDAKFIGRMYGTASSIGALYTGAGDLSIRGEEIHRPEILAFERVFHYPPSSVDIATGSLNVRNMDFAQMFFVHKSNPLSKLTLAQLDAIFGCEHRRGLAPIHTWGQLGLSSDWSNKPINLYGWRIDDDFSSFLQQAILNGSHKWNCKLNEFAHIYRPDGTIYDSGQQILDALAKDPYGIAVSNIRYANPNVKALALAANPGAPYYEATKDTLIAQTYPLTRLIPAFYNRAPGKSMDPAVREFLCYILSREGQADIVRDGGYLPLSKDAALRQLQKLQ